MPLLGHQTPRVAVLPPAAKHEAGEICIQVAHSVGLTLDPWQEYCLYHGCAEDESGRWAAFEVDVDVGRQNGKGDIKIARQLTGLSVFREPLQIHTAHEFKTATEHFRKVRDVVDGSDELRKQVRRIHTANGKESIEFRNGCRLNFLARSGGSGRGFTGDVLYLDEAFKLAIAALGAMLPALSATPNPQVWYMSSAPHADSEVLHNHRDRARSDNPGRLCLLSWSNEPGTDRHDREAWARANPALGRRITETDIENELAALGDHGDEFDRERLGIASEPDAGARVFGPGVWAKCEDKGSRPDGPPRWALDVHPDLEWSSFAACATRADGKTDGAILDRRRGTAWVIERAVELHERFGTPVHVDPRSAAGGLIADLEAAGVKVHESNTLEYTKACAAFQRAVHDDLFRHRGQGPLDAAVAGAAVRTVGEAWAWARLSSQVDISPLVAVTLAFGAEIIQPARVEMVVL